MRTVAEVIEELQRFPPTAILTVHVDCSRAALVCAVSESVNYEVDTVGPVGCNLRDVQITLGVSV